MKVWEESDVVFYLSTRFPSAFRSQYYIAVHHRFFPEFAPTVDASVIDINRVPDA